jgi:hypothetical protein
MFSIATFNPYCQWLDLPSPPTNHYELLGLRSTEASLASIQAAASRQVQKLGRAATAQVAVVRKIQMEIRLAERCLLDPESKSEYDRRLRGERSERVRWRTIKCRSPRVEPSSETVTELKSHVTPAA